MPNPVYNKPFSRSGFSGKSTGKTKYNEDGPVVASSQAPRKEVPYEENNPNSGGGGGMKKGGMATKKMARGGMLGKAGSSAMSNNLVAKKAMAKIQASRQATKPASFKSPSFAPMGAMKGGGIATKGKGVALKSGGSAKAPPKKMGLAVMIAVGKKRGR